MTCWKFGLRVQNNPVISETQHGLADIELGGRRLIYGAADPSAIWVHNGPILYVDRHASCIEGVWFNRNQVEHQGDTLYLFVSDDLDKWEVFASILYFRPANGQGQMKTICVLISSTAIPVLMANLSVIAI